MGDDRPQLNLKLCPFCSQKPSVIDEFKDKKWIACLNQKCSMRPRTDGFPMLSQAASAWNRRMGR